MDGPDRAPSSLGTRSRPAPPSVRSPGRRLPAALHGRPAHPAEPLLLPTDQLVPLAAAPASYALSLGLANGGLFGRVLAFSPGFAAAGPRHGGRRVFISRGARDEVLPIDDTSRDVVPGLRRDGYVVEYREVDGGHVVPPDLARDAIGRVAEG